MAIAYEIDETGFPLVFAAFRGPVQISAFDAYCARLDSFCQQRRRFSVVVDLTEGNVPSAGDRKHIADAIAVREAALRRHCVGSALVITSPLIRGAMTAVLWIQSLPYPYEIVVTREAGRARCAGWLAESPAPTPGA